MINFSAKKLQHDFPKMRGGGVKGCLELFRKFIRLSDVTCPLEPIYTTKNIRHKSFLQIYVVVVVIVILIYIASKLHCVHLDSSLVAGLVQGSPITKPLRSFVKHKVLV